MALFPGRGLSPRAILLFYDYKLIHVSNKCVGGAVSESGENENNRRSFMGNLLILVALICAGGGFYFMGMFMYNMGNDMTNRPKQCSR